jgi:hypothetical protein
LLRFSFELGDSLEMLGKGEFLLYAQASIETKTGSLPHICHLVRPLGAADMGNLDGPNSALMTSRQKEAASRRLSQSVCLRILWRLIV